MCNLKTEQISRVAIILKFDNLIHFPHCRECSGEDLPGPCSGLRHTCKSNRATCSETQGSCAHAKLDSQEMLMLTALVSHGVHAMYNSKKDDQSSSFQN